MSKDRSSNWELTAALEVLDRARIDLIHRDAPAPVESEMSERRYARARSLVERIRQALARRGSKEPGDGECVR